MGEVWMNSNCTMKSECTPAATVNVVPQLPCDENAVCAGESPQSRTCQCKTGYTGSGTACIAEGRKIYLTTKGWSIKELDGSLTDGSTY